MNTINLLNGLNRYIHLASAIAQNKRTAANDDLHYAVSLSYNNIRIKLEKTDSGTGLQCIFEINGDTAALVGVSAESPENEQTVRKLIAAHATDDRFAWDLKIKEAIYPPEIEHYLSIADEIAKEVYLFDSGDDYRPGYFSEIIVTQDGIVLKQINWHNARSSDHKNDYFMRELEFFMPLALGATNPIHSLGEEEQTIGKMQVCLSDRSSRKNRSGGDRIREKINSLKLQAIAP